MKRYKNVAEFIEGQTAFRKEMILLREILRSTGLSECVKWGAPCYTFKGKNVVGIGSFKSYFGLWFFQGALLKDEEKRLMNAQEGVTMAMRQWRFNSIKDINEDLIKSYVQEAVSNIKEGKEIKAAKKKKDDPLAPELVQRLQQKPKLKKAFEALTAFRQQEFNSYILEARRDSTKLSRLEKIEPMILAGKGLNDRYR